MLRLDPSTKMFLVDVIVYFVCVVSSHTRAHLPRILVSNAKHKPQPYLVLFKVYTTSFPENEHMAGGFSNKWALILVCLIIWSNFGNGLWKKRMSHSTPIIFAMALEGTSMKRDYYNSLL